MLSLESWSEALEDLRRALAGVSSPSTEALELARLLLRLWTDLVDILECAVDSLLLLTLGVLWVRLSVGADGGGIVVSTSSASTAGKCVAVSFPGSSALSASEFGKISAKFPLLLAGLAGGNRQPSRDSVAAETGRFWAKFPYIHILARRPY